MTDPKPLKLVKLDPLAQSNHTIDRESFYRKNLFFIIENSCFDKLKLTYKRVIKKDLVSNAFMGKNSIWKENVSLNLNRKYSK